MKTRSPVLRVFLALLALLTALCSQSAVTAAVEPEDYLGPDNRYSRAELIKFFQHYNGVTVMTVDQMGDEGSVRGSLVDLEDRYGSLEVTPAQIREYLKLPALQAEVTDEKAKPLDGIWESSREIGNPDTDPKSLIGPFRLRKNVEDWNKDLQDVSGASLSFTQDNLADSSTWATIGSLIYPIVITSNTPDNPDSTFHSWYLTATPAVNWSVTDVGGSREDDIQELQFQIPLFFEGNHRLKTSPPDWRHEDPATLTRGPNQWRSEASLAPFYLTDFDFRGGILGAAFSYEPLFQMGRHIEVGQYHAIGKTDAAYLIRLQAKMDYGNVINDSIYIDRPENDDFIRAGARMELGIRPFGSDSRWEVKGSYGFMCDLDGTGDTFNDLFEIRTSVWLDESMHSAITLAYRVGETPLADKDVDQLTLSFELRF